MATKNFSSYDSQVSTETSRATRTIHWASSDSQASGDRRPNLPVSRAAFYRGGLLTSPTSLGFAYGLGFPIIGNFVAVGGVGAVAFTWSDNPLATGGYQIQVFSGGVWVNYGAALPAGATGSSGAIAAGTYQFRLQVNTPAFTYSNVSTTTVT